jgi:dipeptidyl aminopeptidase/acylaminoacyl peptidase
MRLAHVVLRFVAYYVSVCIILAVFVGELAFHIAQWPHPRHASVPQLSPVRFGTFQDVFVTASDGVRLQASFARPANENGDAVILLHGVGDNRLGMMGYAEMFLSHGYLVLVPDSRAHGRSGGRIPTYGIKEADDVHQWFDWLKRHQDPNCVFGMGESMGAAILLQSVRTTPFCAVVAESSFANFREIAYIRVGRILHTGKWLGEYALRPAVELAFIYGKLTRGVYLANASPERAVVGSNVPILLIHGLADNAILPQQSEMIRAHNPADIALWKVPNAGHCRAAKTAPTEFTARVLGWFAAHNNGHSQRASVRFLTSRADSREKIFS